MGLLSLFSKENKTTTQNTSNTNYADSSLNAGGAGSMALAAGASVNINDLSEKVATSSLGAMEATAANAVGSNQAVTTGALREMAATTGNALGSNQAVSSAALGSNQATTTAALGSNEAVAKTAISETVGGAKHLIDANAKSVEFLGNTLVGISERAASEAASVRNSNNTALDSARSLISTLQAQTGAALERAQAPEAASIKAIITPVLVVVGIIVIALVFIAGKSKPANA